VQTTVRELVRSGALESAHDISKGGLAVALAESCFGPTEIGADITLDSDLAPELLLFHEAPSRILVSAANPEPIFAVALKNNVEAIKIGVTLETRAIVRNRGQVLLDSRVSELSKTWNKALEHLLQTNVLVNTDA
jgi:phosphoribosylformylglycinamidine synthase